MNAATMQTVTTQSAAAMGPVTLAHDVCALPLVRRLAAMLDRDPDALREGDLLPRGWHTAFFNVPVRQPQLRADGIAGLGVGLPDLGLPRLMLAGRRNQFHGDIPIGARLRRETRQGEVQLKQGRSGRFALLKVEHRIFVEGANEHAIAEQLDYVLREAVSASPATLAASREPAPAPETQAAKVAVPKADATRTLIPDERLLFRYSAITDNPHRIHYDRPYATSAEGYPALVVNGSIPALFLLELWRAHTGRAPASFTSRNVAPMFCGRALHLQVRREENDWHLSATDDAGQIAFDARAT